MRMSLRLVCSEWLRKAFLSHEYQTHHLSSHNYMAAPPQPLPSVPMEGVVSTTPVAQPDAAAAAATESTIAQPSEQPCETLYIQNLNEKIKPEGISLFLSNELKLIFQVMKQTLRGLFKSYGEVLDVVAHNNLRMRGQAFVSFSNSDIAKKAMREVQRFPLYSKPMVFLFFTTQNEMNSHISSKYHLQNHDRTLS